MTDLAPAPTAAPSPARFPLGLASAASLATSLGLLASILNIQWGAGTPTTDALRLAWLNVNIALLFTWLLVWPALAGTRPSQRMSTLFFDLAVIATAAIPPCSVAAFLSAVPQPLILQTIALQLSLALLALAALAQTPRANIGTIASALAALALALPIAGYLWAEFYPAANQAWRTFIPAIALYRAAQQGFTPQSWYTLTAYTLLALALLCLPNRMPTE